jgi:hypothetical protein
VAMSREHKAALAQGRQESAAVRAYLGALEANKPSSNGRQRSAEALQNDLDRVEQSLADGPDAITRLQLIQRRLDLSERIAASTEEAEFEQLEADFVGVAAAYGERKGISYPAWREFGVPAAVLKQAGVRRTRRA